MKIPVLSYHSINDDNSPLSLKINFFENQLKYLKKKVSKLLILMKLIKKKIRQL